VYSSLRGPPSPTYQPALLEIFNGTTVPDLPETCPNFPQSTFLAVKLSRQEFLA